MKIQKENGTRPCCLCGKWLSSYVLTATGVCDACVEQHDGPGKFGGLHGEDLATALILHHWANESGEDEYMVNEGYGYCGRFENFLLIEDSQGFVSIEEYATEEKASKTYDDYFNEGWGASGEDIFVEEDYRDGCPVIWDGDSRKRIEIWVRKNGTCPDTRVDAAIYLHMARTGYFPNVWNSGRYGYRLRKMHSIGGMTLEWVK